ncbi:MAG TPA: hypothetical protein V6C65_11175, partial [Allocoleopsis sp.]
IGGDKCLDFTKPFLPESLAGVQSISCLNHTEKLILNQIRGNSYLYLFGVVEEFIVPLILEHIQQIGTEDILATQAFLCFAEEEGKHIHLFRRFAEEFKAGFGSPCGVIGPAKAIADAVLKHHPLGIALVILQIEWMTQRHYLDSVQNNQTLDPQFCSLLKHHWLEEAQHAKLDTLMVGAMVQKLDDAEIQKGIEDYFAIGAFLDGGLMMQVQMDIESLQTVLGRTFTEAEKQEIQTAQEQAYRWTFLGSGMNHPNFIKTLSELSESAAVRASEMVKQCIPVL